MWQNDLFKEKLEWFVHLLVHLVSSPATLRCRFTRAFLRLGTLVERHGQNTEQVSLLITGFVLSIFYAMGVVFLLSSKMTWSCNFLRGNGFSLLDLNSLNSTNTNLT